MQRFCHRTACVIAALAVALFSTPALAQTPQSLLRQSEAAYEAMHSFSCTIHREMTFGSPSKTRATEFHLLFQAPGKLALTSSGFDLNTLVYSDKSQSVQYLADGPALLVFLSGKKEYFVSPSPDNTRPAFFVLADAETFTASVLLCRFGIKPLSDLAQEKSLTVGPPQMMDGVEVQVISGVMSREPGEATKFSLALGTKDHLVHRFVSTAQKPKPAQRETTDVTEGNVRETCSDIQVNPVLPASAFLPPPGAKKVKPDQNYVGGQ